MNFKIEDILIIIIAFVIGYVLNRILRRNLVEGVEPTPCNRELTQLCGATQGEQGKCLVCAGTNAGALQQAGCSEGDLNTWCAETKPAVKRQCVFSKQNCGLGWQSEPSGWITAVPGQQHSSSRGFQYNCKENQLGRDNLNTDYCLESDSSNKIVVNREGAGLNCLWGISNKCGGELIYIDKISKIEFDLDIEKGTCSTQDNQNEWFSLFLKPYDANTGEVIPGSVNEIDFLEVGTNMNLRGPATNFAGNDPQMTWIGENGEKLKAVDGIQKHVTTSIEPAGGSGSIDNWRITVDVCDNNKTETCTGADPKQSVVHTVRIDKKYPMMFVIDNFITNLDAFTQPQITDPFSDEGKFESNCKFTVSNLLVI